MFRNESGCPDFCFAKINQNANTKSPKSASTIQKLAIFFDFEIATLQESFTLLANIIEKGISEQVINTVLDVFVGNQHCT